MEKTATQVNLNDRTHTMLSLAGVVSSTIAKDTNMVVSPLSLHVVLSVIAAASGGAARDQVMRFLRSKSLEELNQLWSELIGVVFRDGGSSGGPTLSFVNGMWVEQSLGVKGSFDRLVKGTYKAACEKVDFVNKVCVFISGIGFDVRAIKLTLGL